MSAKSKKAEEVSEIQAAGTPADESDSSQELPEGEAVIATARNMPRPITTLPSLPKGKIGKCTVSLLTDVSSVPSVEEVEKLNKGVRGDARTPITTAILAVLARAGGKMLLEELAPEVMKYWNRPFPTSPYSPEEFVYVIVKNSDNIRVS
jgi:hypothetical protein